MSRTKLRAEVSRGVEALRHEEAAILVSAAGAGTYYAVLGPWETDIDIEEVKVASGVPIASGTDTLDLFNGRLADTNFIVESEDFLDAHTYTTFANQPDVPRPITITITDTGASIVAGTITVYGENELGQPVSEVFDLAGPTLSFTSATMFRKVYRLVTADVTVLDGGSDETIIVGIAAMPIITAFDPDTLVASVPVTKTVDQKYARVRAGAPVIMRLVVSSDNSTAPADVAVRIGYDIPVGDAYAKARTYGGYDDGQ